MKHFFILLILVNCEINPPCSVLDSTCNPLGYFIPNLIRPNQVTTGTGTQTGTATPTFPIQANGGPNLISLSWSAQTGATSYRIYRKTSAVLCYLRNKYAIAVDSSVSCN